jgi:hypothetical protein
LSLNPRKSQAILISNYVVGMDGALQGTIGMPMLFLDTDEIPWCDVVTDLWVRFDRQVTKECSRV